MKIVPTPVKSIKNTTKHYTNAEKNARESAENAINRDQVNLIVPETVKADKDARKYWKKTLKELEGVILLDNSDAEVFGQYCIMLSRHAKFITAFNSRIDEDGTIDDGMLKRIESTEKLIIIYAEKLGLTPNSRMRLAKRIAEETEDPDADLYGN